MKEVNHLYSRMTENRKPQRIHNRTIRANKHTQQIEELKINMQKSVVFFYTLSRNNLKMKFKKL